MRDELPVEPVTGLPVSPITLALMAVPVSLVVFLFAEVLERYYLPDIALESRRLLHFGRGFALSLVFAFLGAWAVGRNWARALRRIQAAEERARQAELERLERRRLTALGRLAAGVAHEIRNPLAVILNASELMAENRPEVKSADLLARVRRGIDRIDAVVNFLIQHTRRAPQERAESHVEAVVARTLGILREEGRDCGVEIQTRIDPADLRYLGSEEILNEILLAILRNALDAARPGEGRVRSGRVRISARASEDHLVLDVADDGPGVAEEDRTALFEPYFTAPGAGRGTGLGLSLVHALVMETGGRVTVDRSEWGGALFRVALPNKKT